MKAALTVDGVQNVQRTLGELGPRHARNLMRRLVVAIARNVRDDVRESASSVVKRRTGRLLKAIRSKRERGTRDTFEASVTVNLKKGAGPTAPHWHWIEWGTVKQAPRPYIAPVVVQWKSKILPVFRDEFGKQLEKELAKAAKKAAST